MARKLIQEHRELAITTPLGEDKLVLLGFSGEERLSALFEYEADLLSDDPAIPLTDLLGQPVTIRLELRDDRTRTFNGIVSRFVHTGFRRARREEEESDAESNGAASSGTGGADNGTSGGDEGTHTLAEYRAVIVPRLWLLTRRADCRIFKGQSVPQIVKDICADIGLDVDDRSLEGTYDPWDYCVQYRETDYNFIARLLEQEGIFYFFRHEAQNHVLVLADSPPRLKAFEGYDAIRYMPADAHTRDLETIHAWSVGREMMPGRFAHNDFDFIAPDSLSPSIAQAEQPAVARDHEVFDYPGEYLTSAEGDALASVRLEELQVRSETGRGSTDARGIVVGCLFELTDHPREPEPRTYLVASAAIQARAPEYESAGGADAGPVISVDFTALDSTRRFRPPRITPKPVIQGPQTAIVVGKPADNPPDSSGGAAPPPPPPPPSGPPEEIATDEHGRVWVRFHWDRAETPSCPVRVAQMWAGKKWGGMFIPRIGQEVIVEFLEGDPDRPIITGRVYNGTHKPPYDLPTNKTVSTIKSDTSTGSGGCNEVRFEDKKDAEQLLINAQRRMDVRVKASHYESAGGNREVTVGREDKGDFNRTVCNDINAHNKGGRFELVDKKLNHNVKDEVVEVYEKKQTVAVTERQTLNAKEIVVEAQQTLSLKADKLIAQGASGLSLKAGSVKIEGTQNVSLKCGGSFVVLTPSGVFIKGAMVFLNSGGAAQTPDAPLTMQDPTIETPLDALAASTTLPGQGSGGGGGGGARSRTSRTVPLKRAPEPPPPPPQGPRVPPPPGTDRAFLTIEWVEADTYCGGPATLRGTTRGYTDNATENAEVRNVIDGATLVGVPITIASNAYNQAVEVKDWLPRQAGGNYETERDEDAFAAGQKTPRPLKLKFIPTLTKTACAIGNSQFEMVVTNYECKVEGNISYVKGFMAWIIQLDANVPAGTGGQAGVNWGPAVAGSFSGSDWRFCKDDTSSPSGRVYWDGTAWQNVPATWSDTGSVKLYGIGIWREGTTNKAQFGNNWPEAIPAWAAAQQTIANNTLPTWVTNTNGAWTHKFDLKRDGCASTDQKCCLYTVKIVVAFNAVATRSGHTIIIGANNGRSNAGAWSLGDTRPGLAPHEFGHHLNCPDEYVGGVGIDTSVNTDGATAGIDPTSLMGSVPAGSIPPIKARHLNTIKQHLTDMIQTQKTVAWTFTAVAHV